MNSKGFTLVELIVSIMLYSLILVLFTTSVLAFTRLYELVSKLDDVANDAEVIYNIVDKAYKEKDQDIKLEKRYVNNQLVDVLVIDDVSYYFDRHTRAFIKDDKALIINDNIIAFYMYDYTMINNRYEFRIVYYRQEVLQELYFILGNF